MASLAGVLAAVLLRSGASIELGVLLTLAAGLLGGLLNGLLVSYLGVMPFVATLGTLTIFSGTAFIISGGQTIFGRDIPAAFGEFARAGLALPSLGENLRLGNLTILALLALIVVWVVLEQTAFGRRLYAIGGNREAARLAGVPVRLLRMAAFLFTGFMAAASGLMLASRLASANPTQGDGLMLNAIAAVFIGMTVSEDGEPRVLGTLLGVLLLGVLVNGLTMMQVDSYVQQVITGIIIVLSVMVSALFRWLLNR
jgi:ribose transport system permease protein